MHYIFAMISWVMLLKLNLYAKVYGFTLLFINQLECVISIIHVDHLKINEIEVTSNQQSLIKLKTQQNFVLKRNITRDKMHIYLIQPIQITLN